jgi:ribose/xylose/arabinose/galactoside ABC-type transport system permease subunit
MVVMVLVVGWITTANFLSVSNTLNILRASATTGIAALGVAMITMSGNYFSLSVSATASLCGIVFAGASNATNDLVLAVLAALAVGALLGWLQGALVGLGANPIITTLAFNGALFGVAAAVTGSETVVVRSTAASSLGTSSPDGIPLPVIIFVALIVAGALFLHRTTLGRTLLLVGSNRRTATAVGLSVFVAATAAFTISGVTTAVVGVLSAAQAGSAQVGQITTLDLATVAAVLIGGTNVQGGDGSLLRTALGAVFVSSLVSLLIVRGYSYGIQVFAQGTAVVIAVSLFWLIMRTDR